MTPKADISKARAYIRRLEARLVNDLRTPQAGSPAANGLREMAAVYRAAMQRRFRDFSRGGGDWPPLSAATILARRRRKKSSVHARRRKAIQASQTSYEQKEIERLDQYNRSLSGLTSARRARKTESFNRQARARQAAFNRRDRAARSKLYASRKTALLPAAGEKFSILYDTGLLFRGLNQTYSPEFGATERFIPNGILVGYGGLALHSDSGVTIAQLASWHHTGAGRLPVRRLLVSPSGDLHRRMTERFRRQIAKMIRSAK